MKVPDHLPWSGGLESTVRLRLTAAALLTSEGIGRGGVGQGGSEIVFEYHTTATAAVDSCRAAPQLGERRRGGREVRAIERLLPAAAPAVQGSGFKAWRSGSGGSGFRV